MKSLISIISVSATSPDLELFIDMVENPEKYKGSTIYITNLQQIAGRQAWPDPFLFPNKFYFNEDGEWFESPFMKGGLL